MVKLLADPTQTHFYLVPDDVKLPPGDLIVTSMSGVVFNVERADMARFEVPEEQARAVAERRLALMDVVMRELSAYAAIVLAVSRELELPAPTPSGMLREALAIGDLTVEQLIADPPAGLDQLAQRVRNLATAKVMALVAEQKGG
jgi:hypothetical protein